MEWRIRAELLEDAPAVAGLAEGAGLADALEALRLSGAVRDALVAVGPRGLAGWLGTATAAVRGAGALPVLVPLAADPGALAALGRAALGLLEGRGEAGVLAAGPAWAALGFRPAGELGLRPGRAPAGLLARLLGPGPHPAGTVDVPDVLRPFLGG